jgi:hypothetical protein
VTEQLKAIAKESIPRALEKAERYRLLNEPFFAESICLDVLAIDAANQKALVTYVLAITDQFGSGFEGAARATAAIARLEGLYERLYYAGIVAERKAVAQLERAHHGSRDAAWDLLHQAMDLYTQADAAQKDSTNDDAVLRFNTCMRLIASHGLTAPSPESREYPLE